MSSDYERPPQARAPSYDTSLAGYVIGAGAAVGILAFLCVILT